MADRAKPSRGGPPQVESREQLHAYWRGPDDAPNRPDEYAEHVERSQFLIEWLRPYASTADPILEIGTNVGRNLEYLRQAGFTHLDGIEISSNAVDAMRVRYPDLAATATIHNAPVEDVIRTFADGAFEVVFTMAVLEHIHPDSEWIFAEMVRICHGVIVTIEDEQGRSPHHTPRNYRSVFEGLGMVQLAEQDCSEVMGIGGFVARTFRRPAAA